MIRYIDLQAQYQTIKDEIDVAIQQVLSSSQFILGAEVEAFETEFAQYCQTKYAVGLNSGTSALHLALLAAGLKPDDEVITTSYTFVATAAAICYVGAKPVFVDIDPGTCTMDPAKLEQAITERTRIIVPVHLYGNCADMDPILAIARKHNVLVIEDAAQAHGADYRGRRAGSMGELATFSFYPAKNLGAYGEAGAIVTNNRAFAERLKILRDHGQTERYHHDELGYNYRMEALQGAVLRVKLRHLDEWNSARREHARRYRETLANTGVDLLEETPESRCVYHIFPVFSPQRDALREHLNGAGIQTGVHYPIPIHLQRGYQQLGFGLGDLPITERVSKEALSLPVYPELTENNIRHISDTIGQFFRRASAAPI